MSRDECGNRTPEVVGSIPIASTTTVDNGFAVIETT